MVVSQTDFRRNNKTIPVIIGMILLLGFTNVSKGQSDIVEIKTFISKNGVHPGKTFKVAVFVKINPGWHIHANELADQFLIPTELLFEENEKTEVTQFYYPEPKLEKYEYSESELEVYDGEIIIGALVKTSSALKPGKYKLKGELDYQACDNRSCLSPKKIEFEIAFESVPLSKNIEFINTKIFSKLNFKKD
jgi:DsbC/DsbD-like thiol-disulfide interchange protein